MKSPVFVFSLPRSGSTLLQRVLMSHKDIASVAEPWLMLPFVYAFKQEGAVSEYGHDVSYTALNDFVQNLPNKDEDYYSALNAFAHTLYEKHCSKNEMYFLDKTPRYYFIITEIVKVFPDAKFIFLFRNPLDVMSSMINTWSNRGIWNLNSFEKDLSVGFKLLSEGYQQLKDKSYAVKYEDFVRDPEKHTEQICGFLGLDYQAEMIKDFYDQETKGEYGDTTGVKRYKEISPDSVDKWKETFNTIIRKRLIYRYMNDIDEAAFLVQGYDKRLILNDVSGIKTNFRYLIKDALDYLHYLKDRLFRSGYK